MLDTGMKIVDAVAVDVSAITAGEDQTITTATNLGKTGLGFVSQMSVHRTDTLTTAVAVLIKLQYTTDDGTTWVDAGSVHFPAAAGPAFKTVHIGLFDLVPEQQDASNIDVRAVANIPNGTTTASTVNPTVSVWLGAGERNNAYHT